MPSLWIVERDPIVETALRARGHSVVMNAGDIDGAMSAFFASLPGDNPCPDPLPSHFPSPVLLLPDDPALSPDYFVWGTNRFVSDRLREVFSLPDAAASWVECQVIAPLVRGRYWLFHPTVVKQAVDMQRSVLRLGSHVSAKTGATLPAVSGMEALRFVDGIEAYPGLLVDRTLGSGRLLASDEVARAVVAAGCTGIVFVHPMWITPGANTGVVLGPKGPERRFYDDDLRRVVKVQVVEPSVADLGRQVTVEPSGPATASGTSHASEAQVAQGMDLQKLR